MARKIGVAWSAAAAVAVSLGCGGSGDVSLSDLPARIVNMECPVGVHCGEYSDEAACRAALHPDIRQAQADVAAGTIKYDGVQAAACLDAIVTATQDCRRSQMPTQGPPPACAAIFIGTVADGGVCIANEEWFRGTVISLRASQPVARARASPAGRRWPRLVASARVRGHAPPAGSATAA